MKVQEIGTHQLKSLEEFQQLVERIQSDPSYKEPEAFALGLARVPRPAPPNQRSNLRDLAFDLAFLAPTAPRFVHKFTNHGSLYNKI